MLENLFGFNEIPERITKMKWVNRGSDPDKVQYYDTPNTATDAKETFQLTDIVVFTDAILLSTGNSDTILITKITFSKQMY